MTTVTNDQRSTVTGTGGLFQCGLGLDLVVTSNAITITDSVHFVGGSGTLTTLNFGTFYPPSNSAIVYLISSTGSTWAFGDGGNVQGPYPVVANGTVFLCVWDGTTWHVAYTQNSLTPAMFGAVGDGITDDTVAIQTAITAATIATTITLTPTPNGYFCTAPLVVNQNFTSFTSPGYLQAAVTSDLTNYTGPYPKYGIVLGDSLSVPSAGSTVEGNSISNIRLNIIGGVGGVFASRSTLSRIDNVSVTGTGITYGIRLLASDGQFDIHNCTIGDNGPTLAPAIGLSIENGSHQVHVENNFILGTSSGVQLFNSVGTWIERNTIGTYTSAAHSSYNIKIVTDQAVPSWLTWLPADAASDIHIRDNWFEPSDTAGATIYDIYVGSGVPASSAVIGCVLQDNYFFGTTAATRYPIYIDHADQTIVRGARWYSTIHDLVHITSGSSHAVIDIPALSTYNQSAITGTLISNDGSRTQMPGRFLTPTYSAGTYTALGGGNTWTVQADDVDNFQYTVYGGRMTIIAYIVGTDVGGTPSALQITLPDGWTAVKDARTMAYVVDSNAVASNSTVTAVGGTSILQIRRGDNMAFTASSGTTSLQFQMDLEVQ